jgi:hypothetical protein
LPLMGVDYLAVNPEPSVCDLCDPKQFKNGRCKILRKDDRRVLIFFNKLF